SAAEPAAAAEPPATPAVSVPDPSATPTLFGHPLRINSFGTIGLARHDVAGDQLRAAVTSPSGIGSHWTGAYDSRVGLQLGTELATGVDLTWQGLLHRRDNGDTGIDSHWAFIGWQPTPSWELRAGRFQSPLYLASDQYQVGLAQPWVRPPHEVYGLIGNVNSLDGLWLRRRVALGDETLLVDAYAAAHHENRGSFAVDHEPLVGLSLGLRSSGWLAHATLAQGRTRIRVDPSDPLVAVLALLGNPALGGDPAAVADYDLRRIDRLRFASVGLRWDASPWLAMAELAQVRSASRAFPGATGAYLTLGRSWEPVTLYGTLAWLRGAAPAAESRFSGLSAQLVDAFIQSERESGQTTAGVGLRWDLRSGLALKAQVDHIRPRGPGRGGLFLNGQLPDGRTSAQLYSVALDWAY
ncbi:MAG: hypothetical protein AB9M60_10565, partial [Leptothrix sp. (in: b-proteobacteria)]